MRARRQLRRSGSGRRRSPRARDRAGAAPRRYRPAMDAAPAHDLQGRGAPRLLRHFAALERLTSAERGPSGRARLERELGRDLAAFLVGALAARGAAGERRSVRASALAPELVFAAEADEEEDEHARDDPEEEGAPAPDADRQQADPDVEAEDHAPEQGLEPGAERGRSGRELHRRESNARASASRCWTKKIRRAGFAFVHPSDQLSASAYGRPVGLRPTRAPCSAQAAI